MTVCLRRLRTINKIFFMQERIANLYYYDRRCWYFILNWSFNRSARVNIFAARSWSITVSVLALREIARPLRIGEEPGPSSYSQDIDVIKFYEPYRFVKVWWDLLHRLLHASTSRQYVEKVETIRESEDWNTFVISESRDNNQLRCRFRV